MFPSSEIRVVQQSSDRLIVMDPPYFAAGITMILLSLLGVAIVFVLRHSHSFSARDWVASLTAVPFLLIGLCLWTARTTIVFDSEQGAVMIERRIFSIRRARSELDLTSVAGASVVAGRGRQTGTHLLALSFKSGTTQFLTNYSSQNGHYSVAEAINTFLAVHRKPVR